MTAKSDAAPRSHPGLEWFTGAGLGIFIHWDHSSQRGVEISWPVVGRSIIPGVESVEDQLTPAEYFATAATFNPVRWQPAEVAALVKKSGATYVVFTAKHTAGYVMWHTEYTDFSIEHSPYGRDITRELIDALRAEGIRVGIYFTLADWHHPDYPAFELSDRPYPEEFHPLAAKPEFADSPISRNRHRRSSPEQWQRYLADLRGELTEILTRYGQIDLLWFDGEWERSADEWDTAGIHALIRSLQPNVVINDRLLGFGDYTTPEQAVPMVAPDGPWELCLTMGDHWGYREADVDVKSARSLARTLSEVTSRGGNLLLNISPRGDGSIPETHAGRLDELGSWLERHSEALIDVAPGRGIDFYGPVSQRENRVYLHLHAHPVDEIVVRNLPVHRITAVRLLQTGEHLVFRAFHEVHMKETAGGEPLGELRIDAPQPSGALVDIVAIDFGSR